jgi:hypothetical protein
MPQPNKTYQAKLCCNNCGRPDNYELPSRREIVVWESAYDYQPAIYSATQRFDGTDHKLLFCKFCETPCLTVIWQNEPEVPYAVKGSNTNE